jgi:PiT family inorganic phosphate transporter
MDHLTVVLSGLIAAIIWNLFTWWFGIPSSSSHTLIGGLAGAAIAHGGFRRHQHGSNPNILQTASFIIIAPLVGMLLAFIHLALVPALVPAGFSAYGSVSMFIMALVGWILYKNLELDRAVLARSSTHYESYYLKVIFYTQRISNGCCWPLSCSLSPFSLSGSIHSMRISPMSGSKGCSCFSSAAFSIGHGGNDAQKVMGIIMAALIEQWPLQSGAYGVVGTIGLLQRHRSGYDERRMEDRKDHGYEDHQSDTF